MTPIRIERRLAHPIERVFRAVTEPAEMARWFVVEEIPWTPAEGEEFEAAREWGWARKAMQGAHLHFLVRPDDVAREIVALAG